MTTVSALATTTATPSDSKVAGAASPSNLTATTAGASDPDVIGAPSSAHPTAPAAASSLGHGHGDGNGNAHGNGKAHGNGNGNDSPNDAFTHPPLTKTFSPATEEILKRLPQTSVAAVRGSQEWEAAREAVLKTMTTSSSTDLPATSLHDHAPTVKVEATPNIMDSSTSAIRGDTRGRNRGGRPRGRGRGRGRGALALAVSTTSPSSTPVRGRGRGGRPRGRAGRGGRKPLSEGIKIHEVSSDSDADDVLYDAENTRLATTSRSGRAITKPINFVPVIPSPTSGVKRKRYWGRRNPELAVCKACLRPHSPASNMIVFCDGCNTPYHRYCHHPPISQDVVDVPDMEWFCADCTVRPVPDVDVDTFVAGSHLSEDQKRQVLSLLPTTALVELILRADEANADLGLFPPGVHKTPLPSTLSALLDSAKPAADAVPPNAPEPMSDDSEHTHYPVPVRPDDDVDAGYDEFDDPNVNYPRPGEGLGATLPPEEAHVDWLVDENEQVYSHFVPPNRGTDASVDQDMHEPVNEDMASLVNGDTSASANGTMKATVAGAEH